METQDVGALLDRDGITLGGEVDFDRPDSNDLTLFDIWELQLRHSQKPHSISRIKSNIIVLTLVRYL